MRAASSTIFGHGLLGGTDVSPAVFFSPNNSPQQIEPFLRLNSAANSYTKS